MGFDPISLSLMAAGTAVSAFGAVKSMDAQQRQIKAQQAMSNLSTQQQRLEQVRQGRIKQAGILQMGANQGAGESSSVTTGASGVQGQVESNVQNLNAQQGLATNIFDAQRSEVQGQGIQQIGSSIKGLGNTLFDPDVQAGIKKTFSNVFGD